MEDTHPKIYLYKRIVDAKLYIDNNYHLPLELNLLAEKACFSKFHFLRLFKESFGMSPNKYLTHVRINKAKDLLQDSYSISDVCFHTGFQSIPSFSILFKKHTGTSPKLYADRARDKKEQKATEPLKYIPNCFANSLAWHNSNNE